MQNKRKSGFLLFWFSLLPGAGEMYLGFMRQGISLMCLFWGIIALSSWLAIGPFLFLLPVLWFYSFFHAHNLFRLPDDRFYRTPDTFLFGLDDLNPLSDLLKRFHSSIAIILILFGISILWNCFMDVMYWILPSFLYSFFNRLSNLIPRIAMGFLIIAMGLYFIRGKKRDLSKRTDWEEESEPQNWGYQQKEPESQSWGYQQKEPEAQTWGYQQKEPESQNWEYQQEKSEAQSWGYQQKQQQQTPPQKQDYPDKTNQQIPIYPETATAPDSHTATGMDATATPDTDIHPIELIWDDKSN